MHEAILFIHVVAASIWVGGHLVLAIGLLPQALSKRDPEVVLGFERVYERIGLPAMPEDERDDPAGARRQQLSGDDEQMWRPPWERNRVADGVALATLALFLIFMPIYGAAKGDLFVALLGPGFVLFYLSLSYLISGHWLRLFRRKNDE